MKNISHGRWRQLLAATLAIGGAFQIIAPALAGGTGAGTVITNTATGKFTDGSGTNYDTTSNTVTIAVSEIAGINVVAQTPSVTAPNAGDVLYIDFVVVNTGNDPTQFFIPGTATLSNLAAFAANGPLQIVAVNGTTLGTAVNVPPAGDNTGTLLGTTGASSGSLVPYSGTTPPPVGTAPIGSVTIRVPVKALASATAGQILKVSLGDTTPVDGQNLDRAVSGVGTKDLYTVDNGNGVGGETNATAPTNSVREAMATSTAITVNARLQAFAAVFKAVSAYNNNATPNTLTDDTLTYKLALRVENPTTPPAGLVTSDLYGTQLVGNGDGTITNAKSYVLVSDAIPVGLQFGAGSSLTSTDPKWVQVYTTDVVGTVALSAKWTTAKPATGITRVGFVYDTGANGAISKGAVGVGTTIQGLTVTLNTTATFVGGSIANIAQAFGQSQPSPGVAPAPGTATQIVYDESGDQTANDGLGGTNPDSTTGGSSAATGGITDGVANPTADGTDPGTGNDPANTGTTNTGTDVVSPTATKAFGGEDTVYTVAATPLNGPLGQPGAAGPTDTNDDFTNKSIVIPAGTDPAALIDPAAFTFTNTVQNTSGGTQVISLLPTPPAVPGDLPVGTKVTIKDPNSTNVAVYDYNGTVFVFNPTGSVGTTATTPVKLSVAPGLTPATSPSYQLIVDLPSTAQLKGYPVPVTAFVDANSTGLPAGNPNNITIDRLYTNYLSLDKKARILLPDGVTPVFPADGTFTNAALPAAQAGLNAAATPGNIIEYQITYKNVSTAGGTNSVILPANNLVITESGIPVAGVSSNNWFGVTTDPKYPTPATGTGADSNGGTVTVTVVGTDIQVYTDTIASVAPGTAGGVLTFQRKIK